MSRKQRDPESRQKDSGSYCWNWKKCSAVASPALAIAFACSLVYLLVLIFARKPSCLLHSSRSSSFSSSIASSTSSSLPKPTTFSFVDVETRPIEDEDDDDSSDPAGKMASLGNIVFGIAATARLWDRRKSYVKLWWRPNEMRGFVWLDEAIQNYSSGALPPSRISGSTAGFRYTHRGGRRAAIRISRIVSETFRVGLPDVHWFVMGDDDTIFVPDNLVKVLAKYDHRKFYYIGASSESHHQNLMFSYGMAYGGGGFAISYALASALEQRHDECLERYPFLYGSDDRIHACMSELGVPLTKELGFHQLDVHGDVSGLLSAHPIAPFISMHHLDVIHPIFPGVGQAAALRHLSKAVDIDPAGIFQQSICYDRQRSWSISVSFGYMVKVIRGGLKAPRDLETPTRTFMSWNRRFDEDGYSFTSLPPPKSPCDVPLVFHMKEVAYASRDGMSVSNYTQTRTKKHGGDCPSKSAEELRWIQVLKERTKDSWFVAPRRQCCQIMSVASHSMRLLVRDCRDGELIL
ncbi:glycosyltransferase-like protein [Selaginella moellendorffii]|uniref:Glycosyltransferase-like protein n=1 Tax=Selaginella moellendorffii TaxID=88036 RepID=D8S1N2_SELML|nr:uncharacterized protein LOC9638764 [Selaginella moellendorffii]EFJ21733.1 glycosyltransferase-like protein [Selaginella moellendorffii]|eukprot:XP_002977124.1 uncharacterized protein LOC9638764 [Selaginella moellendorffii]